ncbi:MAG TPA: methyltransferase [Nitrospirota bacterium]|nr:methyltransferase [Nitrospirota bacterium]
MIKVTQKEIKDFARLWGGFRASRVILTANNLSVFEHLRTARSAGDLAVQIGADPRALEILLDAVASLGLLKKTGPQYRNAPAANRFLVKDSPWYQGDMLRHADSLWKTWSGLDEVVRTGRPYRAPGSRDHASFIKAMHNNAVLKAPDVIKAIDLRGVRQAIDLGGGPGTYSRELATRGIAVTLFDLPETIAIARTMIDERKFRNIAFLEGDYHTDDIGHGYELVLISQIFHSLSSEECLELLRKSHEALNPKGRIAIQEFLLEEDRAQPQVGALFSINMLVNTSAGRSYTPQEIKSWLLQAGFKKIVKKVLGDTVVITARKG